MDYILGISMRYYLEGNVEEISEVQPIYDGAEISGIAKPFLTIEYLGGPSPELLSAGRRSYEESYNYQVGIFASNPGELSKLEEIVRTKLREPDGIPIYSETGIATDVNFVCDVGAFTPIRNSELASETRDHHGYLDVAVEILRDTGETAFTQ